MSDPRLSSPSSIRLVAAAVAAVASLGVVALGVQLGTNGLVGDGRGRNPGSATATPASATVDLPRSRGDLFQTQIDSATIAPVTGGTDAVDASATPAPAGPVAVPPSADPDPIASPVPGPTPGPTTPAPTLPPTPVPTPTIPPALDPIVEPVADLIDGLGGASTDSSATPTIPSATDPASSTDAITDVIRQLLGS
ncbi:MAG TPA: hypothetical protein VM143_15380 [Acidimicrobiales bacterium]|nr:hypothetical protein [Acidimicrobiales bacterium]